VQRFRTSDDVEIAYVERGDGVPVIVCHGGPSSTHEYLVGDLAALEASARLVFHDYRGSGASATADRESYTFERLADDVDELRQHLGFDAVVVLAHSMGGFVAIQYALRHPERCRRLVLISCSPAGTVRRSAFPTLRALGARRFVTMVGRAAVYAGRWSWQRPSEARTLARYSIMGVMQQGRPEFAAAVAEREHLADNDNAATLERIAFHTDLCDDLTRITCPVLVMYGTNDAPFAAGAGLLRSRLADVDTVAFAGVGHHPLVEAHRAATRAIIDAVTESR
jgi:pimeloyl-ACP methyl ester carboxylesterase